MYVHQDDDQMLKAHGESVQTRSFARYISMPGMQTTRRIWKKELRLSCAVSAHETGVACKM